MNWFISIFGVVAFLGLTGYVQKLEKEEIARYHQKHKEKQILKQQWDLLNKKDYKLTCF